MEPKPIVHIVPARKSQLNILKDAMVHILQDVYFAENAISKALPKVIEATSNAELKKGLQDHLAETKEQIAILMKVFKSVGAEAKGEKCDAIEGLNKECEGVIDEAKGRWPVTLRSSAAARRSSTTRSRDTAPCANGPRYWARREVHDMLGVILDQEKAANAKLTTIAVGSVKKA